VHKIRINPGNIGERKRLKEVLAACRNGPFHSHWCEFWLSGEIYPSKYEHPTAAALVESALYHIKICEEHRFQDLVISLKSSSVR